MTDELVIVTRFPRPDFVPDGFSFAADGKTFVFTCNGEASPSHYSIAPENMDLLKKLERVLVVYSAPDDTIREALIDRKISKP